MIYEVNYRDPETGATSPIDTVIAPDGYTPEDYTRDCVKNADPEWTDMVLKGEIILILITDEDMIKYWERRLS